MDWWSRESREFRVGLSSHERGHREFRGGFLVAMTGAQRVQLWPSFVTKGQTEFRDGLRGHYWTGRRFRDGLFGH